MKPPTWLKGGSAAAKAAVGTLVAVYIVGTVHFVDNACDNVEAVLRKQIVGQELAIAHMTEAVCHHVSQRQPQKPLVISVHGPPGVGKTYTHYWLAHALYSKQPTADSECPGMHCRGYKVIYGTDFLAAEAAQRIDSVQRQVVSHMAAAPDALLVIEEYDKLDCAARGMWRQLLQHPEVANITSHRAVILMESNLGMTELTDLITRLGDRSKVTMEEAEQLLRDVVFEEWRKSNCESYADTLKLTSLIDVFLPYLPLERSHMPGLMQLTLQQRSRNLARKKVMLQWQPGVVQLLANKVSFEGTFPLDGAKVVEQALRWNFDGLIRRAAAKPGCTSTYGCTLHLRVCAEESGLCVRVTNNTRASLQQQRQVQHEGVVPQQQQQQPHWRRATIDEL